MEATLYKQHGPCLYMINNNIIIELDISQYNEGIVTCSTADARLELIRVDQNKAFDISADTFYKYYNNFLDFLNQANDTRGNEALIPSMPPHIGGAAERLDTSNPVAVAEDYINNLPVIFLPCKH